MRSRHYPDNPSLVFQFIVSEYLAICQLISTLENEIEQKNGKNAFNLFVQLVGASDDRVSLYTAAWETKKLSSFQNYCRHFASLEQAETAHKINSHAKKIQRHCILAMQSIEEESFLLQDSLHQYLVNSLQKKRQSLKAIGRLIEKLFLRFGNHENVLLFLLQKHHELDQAYQSSFVLKIFTKLFPKGIEEVEKIIISQYSQKGYHSLLNQILEASQQLQVKKSNYASSKS